MTAPFFVVFNLDTEKTALDMCCYTPSYEEAEGALEEYASQWLAMQTGVQNEDALDDDRNISDVGKGFHLRFDDGDLYPVINVFHVRTRGDYRIVRRFGVLNVNKWKEDYLDEVTPAVAALAGDDSVKGVVYTGNRPGGRVDRFLKGHGNYASDED